MASTSGRLERGRASPEPFLRGKLYRVNWHQVEMTWNFNRFLVLLGGFPYWRNRRLTQELELSRDIGLAELSSSMYGRLRFFPHKTKSHQECELIVVAEHGRFGNSIRQITYALACAQTLGVREVLAHSVPLIPQGSWTLSNGVTFTHDRLLRPRVSTRPNTILAGDYFVSSRLPVILENFDYSALGSDLASLFALDSIQALPESTLVIHIRSGDVFSSTPHRDLGQPPLSFYSVVIKRLIPSKVILVFEDEANPVIESLMRLLSEMKIDTSIQSSDFLSDLSVLLSARALVRARGTLGDAIELLSPNLHTIVTFSKKVLPRFNGTETKSRLTVTDKDHTYEQAVLSRNWQNSHEQVQMMLSYPEKSLAMLQLPSAQ